MRSGVRLLVSVMAAVVLVSILSTKQPLVVSANSPGAQPRGSFCFDSQPRNRDRSGASESLGALTFGPRHTAALPWEDSLGAITRSFDAPLNPLSESFDS